MKRFLAFVLISTLCLGLCACIANVTSGDPAEEEKTPIRVGFAQVGHESAWRLASTQSCQEAFSAEKGYELLFIDCDQSFEAQLEAVKAFVQQKVDYIIIDPILSTGWTDTLAECAEANIPVIVIDRTIDDSDQYTAWVGSDFYQEGAASGQWLHAYAQAKGLSQLNILMVEGTSGASAQVGRTQGFMDCAREYGWNILDSQSGDFTEVGGNEVMQSFCRLYEDEFNVVVCQNDDEAFGVLSALDAYGIDCGPDGDVIVLSYDACREGLEQVMDGRIAADFECNPMAAPIVSSLISNLEAGREVPESIYLPELWFAHDDTVTTIELDGVTHPVTPVDESILENRW